MIHTQATWSVAENFRYLNSFNCAREQVQKLGRVLGFSVKLYANVKEGTKYYGESIIERPKNCLLMRSSRDRMAQDSHASRWLLTGWGSSLHCRAALALGPRESDCPLVSIFHKVAKASTTG